MSKRFDSLFDTGNRDTKTYTLQLLGPGANNHYLFIKHFLIDIILQNLLSMPHAVRLNPGD